MKNTTNTIMLLAITVIALILTGCATTATTAHAATVPPSVPVTAVTTVSGNTSTTTLMTPTDATPAPEPAQTSSGFTSACLSPTGNLMADFQRCLVFVQSDIQVALDDATAAKDDVGVQCHQAGLALVSGLTSAQPKVVGLISGAEALRITSRSAINNLPLWYNVKDKCAAVYNPGQIFRPLTAGIGVALP